MGQQNTRIFFVLGMHRSGTSALTRALDVCSVFIGNNHLARADNPKGFFEDPTFVRINDYILHKCGITWDATDILQVDRLNKHDKEVLFLEAAQFLRNFCKDIPNVALKDPRASITITFWLPLCKTVHREPYCLVALRRPCDVAASLKARDGMSYPHACALFCLYMSSLIFSTRATPKLFVSYDALIEHPEEELSRIATNIGLPLSTTKLQRFTSDFLDPTLRHHADNGDTAATHPLGKAAQTIYEELLPLTRAPMLPTLKPELNGTIPAALHAFWNAKQRGDI